MSSPDDRELQPSTRLNPPHASPEEPKSFNRPRIVFAYDHKNILQSQLKRATARFSPRLDVRTWSPTRDELVNFVHALQAEDWRPDLLVLTTNFDDGGRSGLRYLAALRAAPSMATLAVVLVAPNSQRDLDLNRVTSSNNATATSFNTEQWEQEAKANEPEAILSCNQLDGKHLRRLIENLPVWREAARGRAWHRLLAETAAMLDGKLPQPEEVGETIAAYICRELDVERVYVGWQIPGAGYKLIGARTTVQEHVVGHVLWQADVPLLTRLINEKRKPVLLNEGVSASEAGTLSSQIAGMKFLGVGAVLNEQTVGFVTLLRKPDGQDFDDLVDAKHLALLARLLASAMGRAELLERIHSQRKQLLDFANEIARAKDEREISHQLAKFLHARLNDSDDGTGKVAVRLVNFSTCGIERKAHTGMESRDPQIKLWDERSVYSRVIVTGKSERVPDIQSPEWKDRCLDTGKVPGTIHAELCVPLMLDDVSIGAANVENTQLSRYDAIDQLLAESAASLASSAISRLRDHSFMRDLADFASRFATLSAEQLKQRLTTILVNFSGASAIVWLKADKGASAELPWQVESANVHLEGASVEKLKEQFSSMDRDSWRRTKLCEWIATRAWVEGWCQMSPSADVSIHLRNYGRRYNPDRFNLDTGVAVLWRRPSSEAPPTGALLLLWGYIRPMAQTDFVLLGALAQLWSSLDGRESELKAWMKTALLGEQAAALGYVMQHFHHRVYSDLGALTGLAQRMEFANSLANPRDLRGLLDEFRTNIERMSGGFRKSISYIKSPAKSMFRLHESINSALAHHESRLRNVAVLNRFETEVWCEWDEDIFQLTLFTLVENALDALAGQPNPTIAIHGRSTADAVVVVVEDSGLGVPDVIGARVFEFGVTTKPNGLGSALAFARQRMTICGGNLCQSSRPYRELKGAAFEIQMPQIDRPVDGELQD